MRDHVGWLCFGSAGAGAVVAVLVQRAINRRIAARLDRKLAATQAAVRRSVERVTELAARARPGEARPN